MKSVEQRLVWALEVCQRAQLRMTPVRHAMLSFLASGQTPVTLEMITQADGISGCCNATTVYRTLMLFKETDIARLIGTPRKTSFFVLNVPDESGNFLICRRCGQIVQLALPESLIAEISRIAAAHGFVSSRHDCEVHGLCQNCKIAKQSEVVPSKLIH